MEKARPKLFRSLDFLPEARSCFELQTPTTQVNSAAPLWPARLIVHACVFRTVSAWRWAERRSSGKNRFRPWTTVSLPLREHGGLGDHCLLRSSVWTSTSQHRTCSAGDGPARATASCRYWTVGVVVRVEIRNSSSLVTNTSSTTTATTTTTTTTTTTACLIQRCCATFECVGINFLSGGGNQRDVSLLDRGRFSAR